MASYYNLDQNIIKNCGKNNKVEFITQLLKYKEQYNKLEPVDALIYEYLSLDRALAIKLFKASNINVVYTEQAICNILRNNYQGYYYKCYAAFKEIWKTIYNISYYIETVEECSNLIDAYYETYSKFIEPIFDNGDINPNFVFHKVNEPTLYAKDYIDSFIDISRMYNLLPIGLKNILKTFDYTFCILCLYINNDVITFNQLELTHKNTEKLLAKYEQRYIPALSTKEYYDYLINYGDNNSNKFNQPIMMFPYMFDEDILEDNYKNLHNIIEEDIGFPIFTNIEESYKLCLQVMFLCMMKEITNSVCEKNRKPKYKHSTHD